MTTRGRPPEFSHEPPKFQRLIGLSASRVGPGARQLVSLIERPGVTDPADPDYEGGEVRTEYLTSPDLWASTQGGVNMAIRSAWEREGSPRRTLSIVAEYHPLLDVDHFFRFFSIQGEATTPAPMGLWRITDMDTTITGPEPSCWASNITADLYDAEGWTL